MQKIIALYATKDRGKTTTLNKLIDLLSQLTDRYEICRYHETHAYFEISNHKIIVCTPGDTQEIIKDNIRFCNKYDCDIFVTATHTRGSTVEEIENLTSKNKAKLVWVKKEDDESQNNIVAVGLLSLILKEIYPNFDELVYIPEN
ncbi:MAG: hypothetical protein IKQ61_04555 [Spirochaetales bacterium]|nr:hypothetical protein [Spirochaetales bacterium]